MNVYRPSLLACSLVCLLCGLSVTSVWSWNQAAPPASVAQIGLQASELLDTLTDDQSEMALLAYDSEKRVDWHFIPMETRKGLKLRDMTEAQRGQAYQLLKSCLSAAGYDKARSIMNMEKLLYSLEKPGTRERRDYLKYYFTFFGDPRQQNRWGLSVEGHHLSLNFVFEEDAMIASTPQFFAANPAVVKTENTVGVALGTQILEHEQQLAFELVNSFKAGQLQQALIAEKAPAEIRNAGNPHPPQEAAVGLPASAMSASQQKMFRQLIDTYATAIPAKVAQERLKEIEDAGFDNVKFAWAGAREPGIGHYYRIQGDSFLIEFVNTQPDAAGNPANHIHCVWRDMSGDFALSATAE